MKELRDYVNRVGEEKLMEAANQVADMIMEQVDKTDEDSITITSVLLKQKFMDCFDFRFESNYLDATFNSQLKKSK